MTTLDDRRSMNHAEVELKMDIHGLTFTNIHANMGVVDLGVRVTVGSDAIVAQYEPAVASSRSITANAKLIDQLTLQSQVVRCDQPQAVVLQHTLHNHGSTPIRVAVDTGLFSEHAAILPADSDGLGWDLRFCHSDNIRTERYPYCQMEYPYWRMLPIERTLLGHGQDQSLPALFIKEETSGQGIIFAASSQDLHFTTFELAKSKLITSSLFDCFMIHHDPRQCEGFEIPPGDRITLDGIYIELNQGRSPENAFVDYMDWVGRNHTLRGARTPLRYEALHCTWNYGVFADQCEASLLPTARCIAENLPGIKWFLMDAGYLEGDTQTTFLDRFYPDPNRLITSVKWPRGIRNYTDTLRDIGLRPGIWWSPTVRVPSQLYTDHPDWFLRRADGSLYLIGGKNAFLDYSVPEALTFLDQTLSVILRDWGMDACKMDFWSQNFEDGNARLRDPLCTSVQVRTQFFDTVRKHLPEDGLFMTCVATGMGNPFIGQWADAYRNTIDIGVGEWHEQKRNCIWALPTLTLRGRDGYLLNNDSVGIMETYPDHENFFRLTWSFMHMGMIETGGRMETWPSRYLDAMRKLTDRCDRGHRCQCPDDDAFTGVPLPRVLFVDFPTDSPTYRGGVRQSVALFNWSDEPQMVCVRRSKLGQTEPVEVENFWTEQQEYWDEDFLIRPLKPRSTLLYDVKV